VLFCLLSVCVLLPVCVVLCFAVVAAVPLEGDIFDDGDDVRILSTEVHLQSEHKKKCQEKNKRKSQFVEHPSLGHLLLPPVLCIWLGCYIHHTFASKWRPSGNGEGACVRKNTF